MPPLYTDLLPHFADRVGATLAVALVSGLYTDLLPRSVDRVGATLAVALVSGP
jgi:hypothetical protein